MIQQITSWVFGDIEHRLAETSAHDLKRDMICIAKSVLCERDHGDRHDAYCH